MKRIAQLDFFRGFFLVVMTINHFITPSNIVYRFTLELIGWTTAAEGFVFLSGFTAGLVYSDIYKKKGKKQLYKSAYKRTAVLYKYHIGVALLLIVSLYVMPYAHAYWKPRIPMLFPDSILPFSLLPFLLFLPSLLDILPMYVIFFLFLPICIEAFFSKKKWWVLLTSLAVYLVSFFWFAEVFDQSAFKRNYMPLILNIFSWQVLFFIGLFLGWLFHNGRLLPIIQKKSVGGVAGILCITFFLAKSLQAYLSLHLDFWTEKNNLGPLRILNFASLTLYMGFCVTRFKSYFTFRPLCYLGRHSLKVFALHILLVYLLKPFRQPLNNLLAIRVSKSYYLYPYETLLLLLVLLALFLAPMKFLKKQKTNAVKMETAAMSLRDSD